MWPSQVVQMRTALNPAALTPSIVAWVHLGLPQTVSPDTPLLMASIWLPIFQPGPIASNTICDVTGVVAATAGATNASWVTPTDTDLPPQETVRVPAPASVFRLAPACTLTVEWWSLSILPVSMTSQDASDVTWGWVEEVTVKVSSPPERLKESVLLLTVSSTSG